MTTNQITTETAQYILDNHGTEWAYLPIRPINSSGTDNVLFLLGDDHVLRLPRQKEAEKLLSKELDWLPKITGLSLKVPELQFRGRAYGATNYEFGIFKWIDGSIASPEAIGDPREAALALSKFLTELHRIDTFDAPNAGMQNNNRGADLAQLSEKVAICITELVDEIDATAARTIWDRACDASNPQKLVWVHGDLKADNLIAAGGALSGVIDWGLSAVGDPAVDFAAAWSWIDPNGRKAFRDCLCIDESDWDRSKGWALYCATIALSFYRGKSHEELCKQSRLTLSRLGLLL